MQISDYKETYALWLRCPGMGLNNVDDSAEGFERYLKRNPSTCFVAEEDGEIIGAILAGNDGRRGIISHTAVAPEKQRQGIGRALVKAALESLAAEGIAKVNLVVFSRNKDGNTFWEKMGFTARDDLVYRNLVLRDMIRYDT